VDNFAGAGQGSVYATFRMGYSLNTFFCRAGPGGLDWTNTARFDFNGGVPLVAPNHNVYLFLVQNSGLFFFFSVSTNRGTNFSAPVSTSLNLNNGSFRLFRSLVTSSNDYFLAHAAPSFAVNPVSGRLHAAYVDQPPTTNRPNIYFHQSTNGIDWDAPIQVNVEPSGVATDQWQPAMTIKPDGTRLFIGWYDRRDDPTNHSLIRMYGALAALPITSTNAFVTNFSISTLAFPPVFSGTNTNPGAYDPAYPPTLGEFSFDCVAGWFSGVYAVFMGDYDRAFSDFNYVYYAWTDGRIQLTSPNGPTRSQADVRFVRVRWP
jgi:hypothetical protein